MLKVLYGRRRGNALGKAPHFTTRKGTRKNISLFLFHLKPVFAFCGCCCSAGAPTAAVPTELSYLLHSSLPSSQPCVRTRSAVLISAVKKKRKFVGLLSDGRLQQQATRCRYCLPAGRRHPGASELLVPPPPRSTSLRFSTQIRTSALDARKLSTVGWGDQCSIFSIRICRKSEYFDEPGICLEFNRFYLLTKLAEIPRRLRCPLFCLYVVCMLIEATS
jgi:hypothetical protein